MKNAFTYRLGIDTGGTFTDFTLFCEQTGKILSMKVPSTPKEPSDAIIDGIEQVIALTEIDRREICYVGHGTTVATNSLIELKGAKTGLITTRGFRDLLEIGRQRRPELYDFYADKPHVLVPRHLRKEVSERITADGNVLRPLDLEELQTVKDALIGEKVESVAVCFLYSYLKPDHEQKVKAFFQTCCPDLYLYLSSEVLPEFREFERLSTTVLCAYLGPVVGNYTERLQKRARAIGLTTDPYITQSNGGIMSCLSVREKPIETALSGPAGGVMASAFLGNKIGVGNLITLDMGGTSADVSLIENGIPQMTTDRKIIGYPVKIPMIEIDTIGAGGGSLAWIDDGGALKVGPQSAGADPGPACYNKGGRTPTVTDANLVLGRINPEYFLGGKMAIYPEMAGEAIERTLCQPLSMDLNRTASGIITIVDAHMVRAIRNISVAKGYDPREFTLLGFGGAGPLHAVAVAKELGIQSVLIPESPGTFSSLGLLVADFRSDFVKTRILLGTTENIEQINGMFPDLESMADKWLSQEKVPASKRILQRFIDMRYQRQNYEYRIELNASRFTPQNFGQVLSAFHEEHKKNHGYALYDSPVEFVNYRVAAYGLVPKADVVSYPEGGPSPENSLKGHRKVCFDPQAGYVTCPIYGMEGLAPQNRINGPAIIEQMGSTIIVPPTERAVVDAFKNIRIQIGGNDKDFS